MIVQVRLFARIRDMFGTGLLVVELPNQASVADLRFHLTAMKPEITHLLERTQVAVEGEFAGNDLILKLNDEIALLPPVSGG